MGSRDLLNKVLGPCVVHLLLGPRCSPVLESPPSLAPPLSHPHLKLALPSIGQHVPQHPHCTVLLLCSDRTMQQVFCLRYRQRGLEQHGLGLMDRPGLGSTRMVGLQWTAIACNRLKQTFPGWTMLQFHARSIVPFT